MLAVSKPLYGGDFLALLHNCQQEAGIHALSIDEHSARAALSMIASLFATGELKLIAQQIEQRGARIYIL